MFGIFKTLFSTNNNDALKDAIHNHAFLVDVRTPAEFSAGSVKGAVNIPLNQLPNQLDKFKNKKSIIVFCRSGSRSGQAKSFLEKNGFDNVFNGGTWQNVEQLIHQQ